MSKIIKMRPTRILLKDEDNKSSENIINVLPVPIGTVGDFNLKLNESE